MSQTPTPTPAAAAPDTDHADVSDSFGLTKTETAELAALTAEANTPAVETIPVVEPAATPEPVATTPAPAAEPVAATPAAEPEPVPAATLAAVPVPAAPQDFAAAATNLRNQYDEGNLTLDEYMAQREALSDSKAEWIAQKAIADQHNAQVAAQAQQASETFNQNFDQAAAAFASKHAGFMGNPIRVKALNDAIQHVYNEEGGRIAPAALFERASAIAFDAFNYKPDPAPGAVRDALDARKADTTIPPTLANAPAAGMERGTGKYSDLDNLSTVDLERTIAGMSAAEVERMLQDASP